MLGDKPLFSIGALHFYPYGMCMALGIIACFVFLYYTFVKHNFNDEAIDKILLIGIFATAFGVFMSMIFQALYDYIEDPSGGYDLSGSMTFQGGLIGGVGSFLIVWNIYVFVIAPRTKVKFLQNNMNAGLTDALPIIPIGITIAHAFGRLGCTFAGCCHGAKTDAWYGIVMYDTSFGSAGVKVVPTQLFECIFLVLLTAVMATLLFKFKFKYNFSLYCIAYGVWRFAIEFARDDHRGSFLGAISPSQFWSIIMVIVGIGFIFLQMYVLSRFAKHPEKQPPVRQPKKKKITPDGNTVEGAEGEEVGNITVTVVSAQTEESESGAAVESDSKPNEPNEAKEEKADENN